MNSAVIQLLVLAGIAVFLILRLRNVLGNRDGFEKPPVTGSAPVDERRQARGKFEVIEGGPDHDITDHTPEGSDSARALAAMKLAEPTFSVTEFLQGARGAYEMILVAFERGDIDSVRSFLANDVAAVFDEVVATRAAQGLHIDADFVGVREIALHGATFDRSSAQGEVTVRFMGELTSVVRDASGATVEGSPTDIKRQRDIWTFGRKMGSNDPNWQLVATGE